jgi:hypothetical protein
MYNNNNIMFMYVCVCALVRWCGGARGLQWDVTLEEQDASVLSSSDKPFSVASVLYSASHRAAVDELRPLWLWEGWDTPRDQSEGAESVCDERARDEHECEQVVAECRARWRYELIAGTGACEGDGDGWAERCVFAYAEMMPRRHSTYFHVSLRAHGPGS